MSRFRAGVVGLACFAVLILAGGAAATNDFPVRLVSETPNTITLGWDPQPGADGYRFYRDGVLVSRTFDPARTTVKFSKGTSYLVEVLHVTAGASGSYPAPIPPPTSAAVWVSTSGNDSTCVRGNQSLPCRTLNRAYQVAQCGDIVDIAAGSYGDQVLVETSAGSACSTPIVFQAATPGIATIRHIQFGNSNVAATDAADNITLKNLTLTWGVNMWADAVNVTLDTIDGGSWLVGGGATNVTIRNSDWGPCVVSSDNNVGCRHYYTGDGRSGQPRILPGASNIVIEGNTFHDMTIQVAGGHWECIWIGGGNNVTIRRNWFYNCETNAMAFGDSGNDSNTSGTWLIENNWAGRVPTANGQFKFGGLPYAATMIFRFNSFAEGYNGIYNEESGNSQGRVIVVGNILPSADQILCVSGAVYDHNVFINDGRGDNTGCGTNRRFVNDPPYLNANGYGNGNYRLSGANGSTAADNMVGQSVPHSGATDDFDGQARPIGPARDAGADER